MNGDYKPILTKMLLFFVCIIVFIWGFIQGEEFNALLIVILIFTNSISAKRHDNQKDTISNNETSSSMSILVIVICAGIFMYGFMKRNELMAILCITILSIGYLNRGNRITQRGGDNNSLSWRMMDIIVIAVCVTVFILGFLRVQELFSLFIIMIIVLGYLSSSRMGYSGMQGESQRIITATAIHKKIPGSQTLFFMLMLALIIVGFMRNFVFFSLVVAMVLFMIDVNSKPPPALNFRIVTFTLATCLSIMAYGFWRNQIFHAALLAILAYYLLPSFLSLPSR